MLNTVIIRRLLHTFYYVQGSLGLSAYKIGIWLAIWLGLPFPVRLLSLGHDEDFDRMMKCLPIWLRGIELESG